MICATPLNLSNVGIDPKLQSDYVLTSIRGGMQYFANDGLWVPTPHYGPLFVEIYIVDI